MAPHWLHTLAVTSLTGAAVCAMVMLADVLRRPQHMWIMNAVWPVSALFGSGLAVWAYFRYGTLATRAAMAQAEARHGEPSSKHRVPLPAVVAKATTHCGAACTLADLVAEWLAFALPVLATWVGWRSLFAPDHKIFAVWILDYAFALLFGIAFQYFTIKPMRGLGVAEGLAQAFKADVLSLTAWQVGVYGYPVNWWLVRRGTKERM